MAGTSAWRVNDVVAYDLMRDSAATLTALLLKADRDGLSTTFALDEVARLRHDVLRVDAYDRDAVAALASRIDARILELTDASR